MTTARLVTILLLACCILVSCQTGRKTTPDDNSPTFTYVSEESVPKHVAILSPTYASDNATSSSMSEGLKEFASQVIRSTLQNHLAGKGYNLLRLARLDQTLAVITRQKPLAEWTDKELSKRLGVDGLIHTDIDQVTMVKSGAFDLYECEASVRMVNSAGEQVGTWSEEAAKRKVSVPTSVIGVISTLFELALSDPMKKEFRHVVYDWGWKIAQLLPDAVSGDRSPEITFVETNVDRQFFGIGSRVKVKVEGEKDLTCFFDLGDFKKDIPMTVTKSGEYEGFYVVRQGDRASNEVVTIHMARPNGASRTWVEEGSLVTLDGSPPRSPRKVTIKAESDGVRATWRLPPGRDLAGFVVERSDKPAGAYEHIGVTRDVVWLDSETAPGSRYYYRIRSVDKAGNLSHPAKPHEVVTPMATVRTLSSDVSGELVPGTYLISETIRIPTGQTLTILPGASLEFAPGTGLEILGAIKAQGGKSPIRMTGEEWLGLDIRGGNAKLVSVSMENCTPCLSLEHGLLKGDSLTLSGRGGAGVSLNNQGDMTVRRLNLSGFDTGIYVVGGKATLDEASISGNGIGIEYRTGLLELNHSNVHANKVNLRTESRLVLADNYLGGVRDSDMRLLGPIMVRSVLDAPYPNGRRVTLMSDADLSPKQLEAQFTTYKEKGIAAFNERRLGDAHRLLSKALMLKDDRDAMLSMAYVQLGLGEEAAMEETLQHGLEVFPYEFRFYNAYARFLLGKDRGAEALELVKKAVQMNPDDANLGYLKEYVEAVISQTARP